MRAIYDWLLPKYVRMPLLMVLAVNMFVYYAPGRLFCTNVTRYDLSIALDLLLPTVPFFLLFYVLAYVQWVGGYIFHCRLGVRLCYQIVTADIIAKALCLICFIAIPTVLVRPELKDSSFWSWATGFFHNIDVPINLFPSIHCLESYMCFRAAMMLPKKNMPYIIFQGVFTVLVFLSTVLIKQHFVVDIPAGIVVCEIGLFLSKRCGLWRLFNKFQLPSAKKWIKEKELVV